MFFSFGQLLSTSHDLSPHTSRDALSWQPVVLARTRVVPNTSKPISTLMALVLLYESKRLFPVDHAHVADSGLVEHSVDLVRHFHKLGTERGGDELCVLCVGLFPDHGPNSCAVLGVQRSIDLVKQVCNCAQ